MPSGPRAAIYFAGCRFCPGRAGRLLLSNFCSRCWSAQRRLLSPPRLLAGHPSSHSKNAGDRQNSRWTPAGFDETLIAKRNFLPFAVTPESSDQIGKAPTSRFSFARPISRWFGFPSDWVGHSIRPGAELNLSRSNLEPWWGRASDSVTAAGVAMMRCLFAMWQCWP